MAKSPTFTLIALLCPVVAGLVFSAFAGAPHMFLAANAAAACFVAFVFLWAPYRGSRSLLLILTLSVPILLALSFAGPSVQNVQRWIAIGPLKLHSAMLVLPFLATQMFTQDRRVIFLACSISAFIISCQPDFASALALLFASLLWFFSARSLWALATVVTSGAAVAVTLLSSDQLPSVRFTENVISDSATFNSGFAIALVFSMMIAIIMPVYFRSGLLERSRGSVLGWSGCLAGFFVASLLGSYPTPLLGYGMSPIIGFGFALTQITPAIRAR